MTVNLNILHPQQLCCVCPEGVLGRHHVLSTVAFFPSVSDNSNANHMQCCIVMLIRDMMDVVLDMRVERAGPQRGFIPWALAVGL